MRRFGSLSTKAWCVWTVALAATPYRAYDGSFAMLPGQVPPGVLSVVLLGLLAMREAFPPSRADDARYALVGSGMAATALSLGIGVFQAVTLQRYLLYEGEMALYGALGAAQALCSVAALVGWALEAHALGRGGEAPDLRGAPISFLAGALWSMPCVVLVGTAGYAGHPWVPLWLVALTCAAAGGFVVAVLALARRVRLVLDPLYLLAGHFSFLAVRLMVGELAAQGLSEGLPSLPVCVTYATFVAVVVAATVISRRRGKGEASPAEDAVARRERVAARLDAQAVRALSESERAVMVRTALGESTRTIAGELGKAEGTIASFRHRGYEKLGVSNARELRALLASDGPSDASSARDETGQNATDGAVSWEGVAFLAFLAVLALVRWPHQVFLWDETISASYVRGLGKIAALMFAATLPLVGAVVASRAPQRPCALEGTGLWSPEAVCAARLAVVALFAGCLYASWDGLAGYGVAAVAILVLACVAFGQDVVARLGGDSDLCAVVRAGASWLLADVPGLALGYAAATVAAHVLLLRPTPFFLYEALTVAVGAGIVAGVLAIAWGRRALSECVSERTAATASPAARQRAVFYLRGRGMGELQANVLVDLACGLSPKEVGSRHSTTSATVASYRRRGYQALGVHRLGELRALLAREAGFSGRGSVS